MFLSENLRIRVSVNTTILGAGTMQIAAMEPKPSPNWGGCMS